QAPYAPPQQQAPYAPPQQAPYAPPQQPPQAAPQAWAPPPQQAPEPAPQQAAGYRDGAKLPLVEAELGTHSVSNFYRGLSGNDIVEHGGIFVSTYNIPEIGQQLRVRVSLPGGLEFEAIGVVRWVREARESMASDISPPGFGLQFTNISAEGRNLIYRYVRNREPMFHDDL
ncbi:MAG TPA: PilZ domain-containing protein, partial [Polyangiaceae bacterium]|nr:PilZ domain-containing protein [Polyangiaceae bacterium]